MGMDVISFKLHQSEEKKLHIIQNVYFYLPVHTNAYEKMDLKLLC